MKDSAKFISLFPAMISGALVTIFAPILLEPFGLTQELVPPIFKLHMFFGLMVGSLVLAVSVLFKDLSAGAYSLTGAAAALSLTFIFFGPAGHLIPLFLLIIAGMLVGAGQYLGARWLNAILPN